MGKPKLPALSTVMKTVN